MGLDMYLTRKIRLPYYRKNYLIDIFIEDDKCNKLPINESKISDIVEDFAYWRKANHIHQWFVTEIQDGIDDCKEYRVSVEQLLELIKLCKEVLANRDDIEKVKELLPTQEGFFFGNTSYNEDYFEQCQDTIDMIEDTVKQDMQSKFANNISYVYQSSW